MLSKMSGRFHRGHQLLVTAIVLFISCGLIGCGKSTTSPGNSDSPTTANSNSEKSDSRLQVKTSVQNLESTASKVESEEIKELKKRKLKYDTNADGEITEIDFGRTKATAEKLKLLQKFPALEVLNLDKTELDDKGLAALKSLKKLQVLSLEENPITNAGLENLKDLKTLEVLSLQKTKITGAGLKHIRDLKRLRVLNLSHTKVEDSGLEHLKNLTDIETLAMQKVPANGSGFVHLKNLKNLITLNLDDTIIKGDAMLNFKDLPKIRIIYMRNAKVSRKSIRKLQDAQPSLAVFQ